MLCRAQCSNWCQVDRLDCCIRARLKALTHMLPGSMCALLHKTASLAVLPRLCLAPFCKHVRTRTCGGIPLRGSCMLLTVTLRQRACAVIYLVFLALQLVLVAFTGHHSTGRAIAWVAILFGPILVTCLLLHALGAAAAYRHIGGHCTKVVVFPFWFTITAAHEAGAPAAAQHGCRGWQGHLHTPWLEICCTFDCGRSL